MFYLVKFYFIETRKTSFSSVQTPTSSKRRVLTVLKSLHLLEEVCSKSFL